MSLQPAPELCREGASGDRLDEAELGPTSQQKTSPGGFAWVPALRECDFQ